MARYYVGVDWGDAVHAVWVCDESGGKVAELKVDQTPEGMSVFGHWLHERTAEGIDLWAGIEKPEGRIVDFLLDHGVVVYSINPKSSDRARDRFRTSRSKEVFGDLTAKVALDFLKAYPTPQALSGLTQEAWEAFAKAHRLREVRTTQLWEVFCKPQLPIPEHVVRAKSKLVHVLVEQLEVVVSAVCTYKAEVERFFASLPAAELTKTLPGGKSGTTIPSLWAELGDAEGRWESFQHLQAQAGTVPVTAQSGKSQFVLFRLACNKQLRYAVDWLAFTSLRESEWAKGYYDTQRARGHTHRRALRALGSKWIKILFVMWRDNVPYDENYHLANMARHHLRQGGLHLKKSA